MDGMDPARWKALLNQANSGELYLDPDTGKGLDKVCDTHIDRLQKVLREINNISKISGFGSFNSGAVLEKKFSTIATGDDRSLDKVIRQHIDAVNDMKAAVAKAIANYIALDEDQRAEIEKLAP